MGTTECERADYKTESVVGSHLDFKICIQAFMNRIFLKKILQSKNTPYQN